MISWIKRLFAKSDPWEYGTFKDGWRARRHRRTGEVQFMLWKPGEHGHPDGFWCRVGAGWEKTFKPGVIPATKAIMDVLAERDRQDEKWGGPAIDDANKTPECWCIDIDAYNTWACQMHRMGSPDKYRRRLIQVAALAIAACESFDRKESAK